MTSASAAPAITTARKRALRAAAANAPASDGTRAPFAAAAPHVAHEQHQHGEADDRDEEAGDEDDVIGARQQRQHRERGERPEQRAGGVEGTVHAEREAEPRGALLSEISASRGDGADALADAVQRDHADSAPQALPAPSRPSLHSADSA